MHETFEISCSVLLSEVLGLSSRLMRGNLGG